MRMPKYLSPSSVMTYRKDPREFYLKYLADNRPPKIPQTGPMSVGSAFDAILKSHLHKELYGNYGEGDMFSFGKLFEAQVEPHNRDFAKTAGMVTFLAFKSSGALADLMLMLSGASGEVKFETTIEGRVSHAADKVSGVVPLLGKPDCYFRISDFTVIIDFKVNGYCSKSNTSPKKGYVKIYPSGGQHKDCCIKNINTINVNIAQPLEIINEEWALQDCIYGWVLGAPVGSQIIGSILQVSGQPGNQRVSSYNSLITQPYQVGLFIEILALWGKICSVNNGVGRWFDEKTDSEDREARAALDEYYLAFAGDDPRNALFATMTREERNY